MKNTVDARACRELAGIPQMHEFVYREAQRAMIVALSFAPYRTGHYVRGLYARQGAGGFVNPNRASASFGSDDFKAWWIEFGAKNRPYHTLMLTAKTMGYRIADENRRAHGAPPIKANLARRRAQKRK